MQRQEVNSNNQHLCQEQSGGVSRQPASPGLFHATNRLPKEIIALKSGFWYQPMLPAAQEPCLGNRNALSKTIRRENDKRKKREEKKQERRQSGKEYPKMKRREEPE
jgi:hypothetical protein